jgi:nitrilase
LGDVFPVVRVAAVQAAPVYLDREATVEKAVSLIRQAADGGARLVVFPEGFIPGHPLWYHFKPATDPASSRLAARLFQNAVTIPSPATERLARAARGTGTVVVMGLCEKSPDTFGTLYNSQLFLGPDGAILGKHQKLTPTVGERLVHTGGFGDTLGVIETSVGRLGGLICGESSNPLAVFALMAEYAQILAVSWPNRFPKKGMSCPERSLVVGRALAISSKAFVVNACGAMSEEIAEAIQYTDDDVPILNDPTASGGSSIIGPRGNILAGPLGPEEGILYADLDLNEGVEEKVRHDYAGHYNRPDVFQLTVRRSRPALYRAVMAPHPTPEPAPVPVEAVPVERSSPSAGVGGAAWNWKEPHAACRGVRV